MPTVPRRRSLIDETASALRERIDAGEWTLQLPGEAELAQHLQVGRNTLRAALTHLEAEGRIRTRNGQRRQILLGPGLPVPGKRAILLMARPVGEYPPATGQWIEATRVRLESQGWSWRVLVQPQVFRGKCEDMLPVMARSHPGTVWILHRSTYGMQHWFRKSGERCVLAGSPHEGVVLPHVEIDYTALSHHAAGRFLSRGHQRFAVLRPAERFAGDEESVAAFREALGDHDLLEIRCRHSPYGAADTVKAMMQDRPAPTALYVLHAEHCLSALTALQETGVSVPGKISLICRDDAPYLKWLSPEPSRYCYSAKLFATKLSRLVSRPPRKNPSIRDSVLIMPTWRLGGTLRQAAE